MSKGSINIEELHKSVLYKVLLLSGPARTKMPVQYATAETFLFVKKGHIIVSLNNAPDVELRHGNTLVLKPMAEHGLKAVTDFELIIVIASTARIQPSGAT